MRMRVNFPSWWLSFFMHKPRFNDNKTWGFGWSIHIRCSHLYTLLWSSASSMNPWYVRVGLAEGVKVRIEYSVTLYWHCLTDPAYVSDVNIPVHLTNELIWIFKWVGANFSSIISIATAVFFLLFFRWEILGLCSSAVSNVGRCIRVANRRIHNPNFSVVPGNSNKRYCAA